MLWFWFVIGLIMAVIGVILYSYGDYIRIKKYSFDSEPMGIGICVIGGALAALMLFGNGIMCLVGTGA